MWNDFTALDGVGLVGALLICAAYLLVSHLECESGMVVLFAAIILSVVFLLFDFPRFGFKPSSRRRRFETKAWKINHRCRKQPHDGSRAHRHGHTTAPLVTTWRVSSTTPRH